MNLPIDIPYSVIGVCLVFGVVLAICVGRFLTRDHKMHVNPEWALQLSTERYRPMLRLLSDDDVAFLRAQPGFKPSMAAKLRAQRCQIFQAYMHSLDRDFRALCAATKTLIVQSHQDRPDLARALFRTQFSFTAAMWSAKLQMLFYRLGVGTVDASGLVARFDLTRTKLRDLAPAVMAASL
jgi:hypothetical protein